MTLRSRARQQQLWGDVTPCSCFGQEIERLTLTPSRRGPPFAFASQSGSQSVFADTVIAALRLALTPQGSARAPSRATDPKSLNPKPWGESWLPSPCLHQVWYFGLPRADGKGANKTKQKPL